MTSSIAPNDQALSALFEEICSKGSQVGMLKVIEPL